MTPKIVERFLRRISPTPIQGECWEWRGARLGENGYGKFQVKPGLPVHANRFMFALIHGEKETNRHDVIRHVCDNPPCVNPLHLIGSTYLGNTRDMVEKGRYIPPGQGVTHWNAKVDEKMVREIRRRAALGETNRSIADDLGLTLQNVYMIVIRKRWKHVA